jgi:hypothetical protein
MTRREYCVKHNIEVATLDYWRRVEKQSNPNLVEVAIETQPQPTGGFVLVLANGRRIESSWNFAAADLTRLIHVAEG